MRSSSKCALAAPSSYLGKSPTGCRLCQVQTCRTRHLSKHFVHYGALSRHVKLAQSRFGLLNDVIPFNNGLQTRFQHAQIPCKATVNRAGRDQHADWHPGRDDQSRSGLVSRRYFRASQRRADPSTVGIAFLARYLRQSTATGWFLEGSKRIQEKRPKKGPQKGLDKWSRTAYGFPISLKIGHREPVAQPGSTEYWVWVSSISA